jgi:hypothetical protein
MNKSGILEANREIIEMERSDTKRSRDVDDA